MMTFLILSKEDCVWCDKAKALIKEKGDTYTEVDYKTNPVIVLLMKKSSIKTVPQIWVDTPNGKEYIGGYKDLDKFFHKQGSAKVGWEYYD